MNWEGGGEHPYRTEFELIYREASPTEIRDARGKLIGHRSPARISWCCPGPTGHLPAARISATEVTVAPESAWASSTPTWNLAIEGSVPSVPMATGCAVDMSISVSAARMARSSTWCERRFAWNGISEGLDRIS